MKKAFIIIAITITSCRTAPSFIYAPVKITTAGSKIIVTPMSKFRPMPDTTIYGYLIKRNL